MPILPACFKEEDWKATSEDNAIAKNLNGKKTKKYIYDCGHSLS